MWPTRAPDARLTGRGGAGGESRRDPPRRCGTVSDVTAQRAGADQALPAVELRGVTKRFPGVVANRDVDLRVARGEVHAVVGENGAGKSTLMKTLYGMHRPDEGQVLLDGREVHLDSPSDAIDAGIGMVHQHFMLADQLTVLENVVLGSEPRRGVTLDTRAARRRIAEVGDAYGLDVDPDRLVEDLGVGERQRVEILKVLYRGARVLILDEPTAVLVPQEVDELFANLDELRREGLTVVFISHKLDEVLAVADTVTVLRRGTTVGTVRTDETSAEDLARLMVGGTLPDPGERVDREPGREVLRVDGLTVRDDGRTLVDDVTFTVRGGQVLGVAGVEGNGQAELVDALLGLRPAARGTVHLDTGDGPVDVTDEPTRRRRERGIGFVPEDRQRSALLLDAPLWENRVLGHQTRSPVARGPLLDRGAARRDAERVVAEYDVRTPGVDTSAHALSGGNQQKFVVGRELSGTPALLVLAHPTRGVDVGAQAAIWARVREAQDAGQAVLLVSADLDELIGLSDRLLVLLRGGVVAEVDPATVTPAALGAAMTGAATTGATDDGRRKDRRDDGVLRRRDDVRPLRRDVPDHVGPGRRVTERLLRLGTTLVAPVAAVALALVLASAALLATGEQPLEVYRLMLEYGVEPRSVAAWMDQAVPYYLSGIAVAIGFRMGLFNIGVDGQYRVAAFAAASVAGYVALPGPLTLVLTVLTAVVVGALWAGIAGYLRTSRGVSEVISTIMLNFVATALVAYLLAEQLGVRSGNNISTPEIPEGARVGQVSGLLRLVGLDVPDGARLTGLLFLAVAVGIGYHLVLTRTRVGFDLRATGMSASAARASGVDAKRMTLIAVLASGGVAGLVGLPQLLSDSYDYSIDFPAGFGFTGIAVALVGRNHPVGVALGAVLFAFIERAAQILEFEDIPKEIGAIMQGSIVLSVVVAYEVVSRVLARREEQAAAAVRDGDDGAAPPDDSSTREPAGASR